MRLQIIVTRRNSRDTMDSRLERANRPDRSRSRVLSQKYRRPRDVFGRRAAQRQWKI